MKAHRVGNIAAILSLGLATFAISGPAFADAFPDAISVPEPSSMSLFAVGIIAAAAARKFKQRK